MTTDYNQIKKEYLTGAKLNDLAEKNDIGYQNLRNRAAREGWSAEKHTINNAIVANLIKNEAEEIQAMRNNEREDILLLSSIIQNKISDSLQPVEIQQLTASYEKIQKMLYKSYGISDKLDLGIKSEEDTEFKIIKTNADS